MATSGSFHVSTRKSLSLSDNYTSSDAREVKIAFMNNTDNDFDII